MVDDGDDLWIPIFWEGRDSWNGQSLVADGEEFPIGSEIGLGGADYNGLDPTSRKRYVPPECPDGADQKYFGVGDSFVLVAEPTVTTSE